MKVPEGSGSWLIVEVDRRRGDRDAVGEWEDPGAGEDDGEREEERGGAEGCGVVAEEG